VLDFGKIPRPSFGTRQARKGDEALGVPLPLRGKALRRRQVMAKEAAELLPHLPMKKGTATHCLLTGRADLMVVLAEALAHYCGLAQQAGSACRHLRIATLSFNDRNTSEMAALLQAGRVEKLTLLCSLFFRQHNAAEYAEAKRQAAQFPDRWSIAAARNHAKVVCMDLGGRKIVAEGSANLRSNGNSEQLSVIVDDQLHDWHAQWIDDMVSKHAREETEEGEEGPAAGQ
jgi:hypothetical protein